jgi:hypothetical protein
MLCAYKKVGIKMDHSYQLKSKLYLQALVLCAAVSCNCVVHRRKKRKSQNKKAIKAKKIREITNLEIIKMKIRSKRTHLNKRKTV